LETVYALMGCGNGFVLPGTARQGTSVLAYGARECARQTSDERRKVQIAEEGEK